MGEGRSDRGTRLSGVVQKWQQARADRTTQRSRFGLSAFTKNFLFIDHPQNDDLAAMKAAGFDGAFGNVRDYPPALWSLHRAKAAPFGMFFGPWGRTSFPNTSTWDPS